MLIGWLRTPRARLAAQVTGALAALAMIIVGCTSVTDGEASVSAVDAPAYRASVSASLEESAASSSARESERQSSVTAEAVKSVCESMSSSSAEAIGAVNVYVDAFNTNAGDVGPTAGSAIDALNASADLVVSSISGPLTPELRDALTRWVDAARAVATAIAGNYGAEEFNAAIAELNASKTSALDLCDAAYR